VKEIDLPTCEGLDFLTFGKNPFENQSCYNLTSEHTVIHKTQFFTEPQSNRMARVQDKFVRGAAGPEETGLGQRSESVRGGGVEVQSRYVDVQSGCVHQIVGKQMRTGHH
jgi:hypothetical protein